MESGFIKLSRRFFSHEMREAARTFSECEAWIDLIQSARFEATVTIERIGGRDCATNIFLKRLSQTKEEKK